MARKFFSWLLILLSGLFLLLSIAGVTAIWVYRKPLTDTAMTQLTSIDSQLSQAQITLDSSQQELERALRIVNNAQASLDKIKKQTNSAGNLMEDIQGTLNNKLLPDLKATHGRILSARNTLTQFQSFLTGIKSFVPGLDLSAPDKTIADLVASANALDSDIANAETLATQASQFLGDTAYLFNGDLTETRNSLQNFVSSIATYQTKIAGWRKQTATLMAGAPRWINEAAVGLTIFLLWFAVSQFGLLLHGLSMLRGEDPFRVLRRTKIEVQEDGVTREEVIDS